jgi:hypothetical protein
VLPAPRVPDGRTIAPARKGRRGCQGTAAIMPVNGMVERFHGRVQREVLGITVASHRGLERLLAGFNAACNARRQRVLGGRSPEQVVRERLHRKESLANPTYRPPPDPCVVPKATLVVARAKGVSQPNN